MRAYFVFAALIAFGAVSANAADRPNVIFFAVDDMCDWVGPLGDGQAITPNMNALAKNGVTFTGAHCPGTYCAPSRAAVFTGRYASTTGCYGTEVYYFDHPEYVPLQQAFKNGGYETFGAGKLFHHREGYLDKRGWTEFFVRNDVLKRKGWRIETWPMAEAERDVPFPNPFPASIYNRGKKVTGGLFLEWGSIQDGQEEEMADTRRVNYACEVLRREHDKPFFLALGLYSPHFPNYAPQKYFDLYDADRIKPPPYKEDDLEDLPPKMRKQKENRRRRHHEKLVKLDAVEDAIHGYLACVSYADAMLGRVLKTLRESPYADNTIVVLWSDHGYHHGEKGDWGKHTLWERTSNVPFIWSGPGVARSEKVDATVSLIDMYPTFVDMCDLHRSDGLEGESLARTLSNPATANDRDVFLPYLTPGGYAIVNQDWRYIHYDDDTEELYDVRRDPNEWNNLASDESFSRIKTKLRGSAPRDFARPATPLNRLRLVVEGTDFRWELKRTTRATQRAGDRYDAGEFIDNANLKASKKPLADHALDSALDSAPFLTLLACEYVRRTGENDFLRQIEPKLRQALGHVRRADNGLVYNPPDQPQCAYGFTDIVTKTGHLLFTSLLYYQACVELDAIQQVTGGDQQFDYAARADLIRKNLSILWNDEACMFWAADKDCRQIDIWGSAYAPRSDWRPTNKKTTLRSSCSRTGTGSCSAVRSDGCTVMLGVPTYWRELRGDAVDEGTAIVKCKHDPPVGEGVRFLGYEGRPSDHYLRLLGEADKVLRGENPLTDTTPQ